MSKHTPGPWEIGYGHGITGPSAVGQGHVLVTHPELSLGSTDGNTLSAVVARAHRPEDARLIAAAPELLKVLRKAQTIVGASAAAAPNTPTRLARTAVYDSIVAVIAKAEEDICPPS